MSKGYLAKSGSKGEVKSTVGCKMCSARLRNSSTLLMNHKRMVHGI